MIGNTFLACPNCGDIKKFRIFTRNFQIVEQSPQLGVRTFESAILPSFLNFMRSYPRVSIFVYLK